MGWGGCEISFCVCRRGVDRVYLELSSLLTALNMSYVNQFTDHAVYIPLRLFIEYGLR